MLDNSGIYPLANGYITFLSLYMILSHLDATLIFTKIW